MHYNAIIPKSTTLLKTLYLLHGWSGNHDDWIKHASIVELAKKYHIAIILPNGENSFYTDFSEAESYGKMVAEDLLEETQRLFKLSHQTADTWIAGLSMGGYGALRLGLIYSYR
ncbi:alpha/beta hydrolase-fold protein [Tuanshanicoccus lijuaniae]|uniref:alpha/beta hydrolase-fold protein n=1 Tax=Aerococcaceae bacterium zg-1292 TaxID=2774330 RepID=UPI004063745F